MSHPLFSDLLPPALSHPSAEDRHSNIDSFLATDLRARCSQLGVLFN
jgi:hypothetical protein